MCITLSSQVYTVNLNWNCICTCLCVCVCVHVLREKDIGTTLRCGVRKKLSWKPCFEHSSDFKVNVLAPG